MVGNELVSRGLWEADDLDWRNEESACAEARARSKEVARQLTMPGAVRRELTNDLFQDRLVRVGLI